MFPIQILLPCADNAGNRFPRAQFDRVSDELARSFSGVTTYLRSPAEGTWRGRDRRSEDEIVIFEVMADKVDQGDWRRHLERLFRQDTVLIRYSAVSVI